MDPFGNATVRPFPFATVSPPAETNCHVAGWGAIDAGSTVIFNNNHYWLTIKLIIFKHRHFFSLVRKNIWRRCHFYTIHSLNAFNWFIFQASVNLSRAEKYIFSQNLCRVIYTVNPNVINLFDNMICAAPFNLLTTSGYVSIFNFLTF